MEEAEGSSAEGQLQERHVAEDTSEPRLEEESEIREAVAQSLSKERQVPGLANQQVAPLHDHNRHEVRTLRISERLRRIADWLVTHPRFIPIATLRVLAQLNPARIERARVDLVILSSVPDIPTAGICAVLNATGMPS